MFKVSNPCLVLLMKRGIRLANLDLGMTGLSSYTSASDPKLSLETLIFFTLNWSDYKWTDVIHFTEEKQSMIDGLINQFIMSFIIADELEILLLIGWWMHYLSRKAFFSLSWGLCYGNWNVYLIQDSIFTFSLGILIQTLNSALLLMTSNLYFQNSSIPLNIISKC